MSDTSSPLEVHQFGCLSDNYGYLLHDPASGSTAAIDTPEVSKIQAALSEKGWTLTHIFNTHHHYDHAGGNEELKNQTGALIIGPKDEADKIPTLDRQVADQDTFKFGTHDVHVLGVGGHTLGHIAFYIPDAHIAFVGDALFALGCGRIFEGTPAQMWTSLQKLKALPDDTVVYCAHEYTQANANFAITVEPGNKELVARVAQIAELRRQGKPTIPTSIALEKATNPFLRPDSDNLQITIGRQGASLLDVFTKTRQLKDKF